MILSDQTTFRIGRIRGLSLLLVAISFLPLTTAFGADDEPEKTAPQRQEAEPDPKKSKPTPAVNDPYVNDDTVPSWHQVGGKAADCMNCHRVHWGFHKPVGTTLADWGKAELSGNQRKALGGATKELRDLGFDETLIETLITERSKARRASEILQGILSPPNDMLRVPRFHLSPEEEARVIQYINRLRRDDLPDPQNDSDHVDTETDRATSR